MSRYPVKLAYELIEPKEKSSEKQSPVIFLHAMGLSKEDCWKGIPQMIADISKRKIYNLDARNHGDSEWSDEFDYELNAIDLLHFIDCMKIPKVVIVGHCLGGITGMLAALKEPEKIERLFVVDIFLNKIPEIQFETVMKIFNVWKDMKNVIPSKLDKREVNKFISYYTYRKVVPFYKPENVCRNWQDMTYPLRRDSSDQYVFKNNMEVICQLKNVDLIPSENEGIYEGPSYFLIATGSLFKVGEEKENILKLFPKALIIPFEGDNHFIHAEFPEEFIMTIVKHLQMS